MKLSNLPVEATFGEIDSPDWKAAPNQPTAHDEDSDSEEAGDEDRDFVKATLGFDPSELFNES